MNACGQKQKRMETGPSVLKRRRIVRPTVHALEQPCASQMLASASMTNRQPSVILSEAKSLATAGNSQVSGAAASSSIAAIRATGVVQPMQGILWNGVKPRPCRNLRWETGGGEGSCWINAALEAIFAPIRYKLILSQIWTEQTMLTALRCWTEPWPNERDVQLIV